LPRERAVSDREPRYARRIGWYALVRALKPRLVVETGIDKGLGSVVLCAALRRNAAEGAAGRYVGTDIRPEAGHLLRPPYADVGEVRYGDSLASLAQIADPIDLFINDSDHSAAYEGQEYATIAPRLSAQAVIVGDNAYATDELAAFAERTGRRFVFWREQPAAHFYPGAGIGFAFR
jgi:predicted O-methyltransferase YrrM